MADINVNISSAFVNFHFRDENGDIISSFRLNPADIKLAARCEEISEKMRKMETKIPDDAGLEAMLRINDEIEEQICYILGYDAKKSVFGNVSATSIMDDGEMFAVLIINTISEAVKPTVEKRMKAMESMFARYTERYQ